MLSVSAIMERILIICSVRNFHKKKIYLLLYFPPVHINKSYVSNILTFYDCIFPIGYAISSDEKEHKDINYVNFLQYCPNNVSEHNYIKFLEMK